MTQITGGEVTYERRVTTGDYQHKHLKVTLNFSVDEGQTNSAIADETLSRAIRLVEEGLRPGLPPAPHKFEARCADQVTVMDTGRAAATNGMEFLKKWWTTLQVDVRNELMDFKDKELKPMAEKADAAINNNMRAG